jgi:hypothetical protein
MLRHETRSWICLFNLVIPASPTPASELRAEEGKPVQTGYKNSNHYLVLYKKGFDDFRVGINAQKSESFEVVTSKKPFLVNFPHGILKTRIFSVHKPGSTPGGKCSCSRMFVMGSGYAGDRMAGPDRCLMVGFNWGAGLKGRVY